MENYIFFLSFRIITVDISLDWPEKRNFLSGTLDGVLKQWSIDVVNNKTKIKETQCHDVHKSEHEVSIVKINMITLLNC